MPRSLLNKVSIEQGLYWTRFILNKVSTGQGIYWTRYLQNKVSTEHGLYWTRSLLNKFSTEQGLYWTRNLLNKVPTEQGLSWTRSQLNKVSTEQGLYWTICLLIKGLQILMSASSTIYDKLYNSAVEFTSTEWSSDMSHVRHIMFRHDSPAYLKYPIAARYSSYKDLEAESASHMSHERESTLDHELIWCLRLF